MLTVCYSWTWTVEGPDRQEGTHSANKIEQDADGDWGQSMRLRGRVDEGEGIGAKVMV
jgi:hypothetical protein